jgi:dolichol kinase
LALAHHLVVDSPIRQFIAISLFAGFVFTLLQKTETIRRENEKNLLSNILGYALPVLLCVWFFPQSLEIAFTVWVILAFGDGSATLGGLLLPSKPLPWNAGKTWSGLGSFILLGGSFAALISREASGASWPHALNYGFAISAFCAVVETLPTSGDDNPRVGTAASLAAILAHWVKF